MDSRIRFAVAGEPIGHSLSPELFALVAEHLGLNWDMPKRISTTKCTELDIKLRGDFEKPPSEFLDKIVGVTNDILEPFVKYIPYGDTRINDLKTSDELSKGTNCFVSITTPLKHQYGTTPINCLKYVENDIRSFNSDGLGFVAVARHFNIFPEKGAILGLKGGGSTALATSKAWISAGGSIKYYSGRRELNQKSFDDEMFSSEDIFVDYDESSTHDEILSLSPRYGENEAGSTAGNVLDGTWLLVAQHLVSWNNFFGFSEELPSLGLLMSRLSVIQNKI